MSSEIDRERSREFDKPSSSSQQQQASKFSGKSVKQYSLSTNYMALTQSKKIIVYKVAITSMDAGGDNSRNGDISRALLKSKENLAILDSQLGGQFYMCNNLIFSPIQKNSPIELEGQYDGKNYKLTLIFKSYLQDEDKLMQYSLISKLFKNTTNKLGFNKIGDGYFNMKDQKEVQGLTIIKGFTSRVEERENHIFLRLSSANKILRTDDVLDKIRKLQKAKGDKWVTFAEEELLGRTVMTSYSKTFYRVSAIDCSQNPNSKFQMRDGTEKSYADYYKEKYSLQNCTIDQPLLVSIMGPPIPKSMKNYDKQMMAAESSKSEQESIIKKYLSDPEHKERFEIFQKIKSKQKKIYLIPEYCRFTGLEESHIANTNLMKDMKKILDPQVDEKVKMIQNLAKTIQKSEKGVELNDSWGLKLQCQLQTLKGDQKDPGNLVMKNQKLNLIKEGAKLETKIKQPMLDCNKINNIVLLYPSMCKKEYQAFTKELKITMDDMKIAYQLKSVEIKNPKDANEWLQKCKDELNAQVTLAYFILTGKKKDGDCYYQIKNFLYHKVPVPSQVIMPSTITGKNLGSIFNKMVIQTVCKIGRSPWHLDEMPFSDKPSLIIGLTIEKNTHLGNHGYMLGLASTVDKNFSKYWSGFKRNDNKFFESDLTDLLYQGISDFFKNNVWTQADQKSKDEEAKLTNDSENHQKKIEARTPTIIIYRSGAPSGEYKSIQQVELECFNEAIAKVIKTDPYLNNCMNEKRLDLKEIVDMFQIVYINVNRAPKLQFYKTESNKFEAILAGTLITDPTVCKDNEFYLSSCIPRIGAPKAMFYNILHNGTSMGLRNLKEKLGMLTFKLCYLYFNTVGAIKVPAPLHYSDRMVKQLKEVYDKGSEKNVKDALKVGNAKQPHVHYGKIHSLYFVQDKYVHRKWF